MKAIPEARMVAARIQGPDRAVRGTSAFVDSITASSHGGFMAAVDASRVDSVWPGLPSIIREFFKNQSRRSQRLNRLDTLPTFVAISPGGGLAIEGNPLDGKRVL
jgi:hypothetical protein